MEYESVKEGVGSICYFSLQLPFVVGENQWVFAFLHWQINHQISLWQNVNVVYSKRNLKPNSFMFYQCQTKSSWHLDAKVLWSVCLWTCARIPPVNNGVVGHRRKALGYFCSYIDKVSMQKLAVNLLNLYLQVSSQFFPLTAQLQMLCLPWGKIKSSRSSGVSRFVPIWSFFAPTQTSATNLGSFKYGSGREQEKQRWQKSKSRLKSVSFF